MRPQGTVLTVPDSVTACHGKEITNDFQKTHNKTTPNAATKEQTESAVTTLHIPMAEQVLQVLRVISKGR